MHPTKVFQSVAYRLLYICTKTMSFSSGIPKLCMDSEGLLLKCGTKLISIFQEKLLYLGNQDVIK